MTTSAFALPDHLAHKADPALIGPDEQHFAAVALSLERSLAELGTRLADERRRPGGRWQAALERDQEVHRLTARLKALRRYGLDLCLGRIVGAEGAVYVGRFGLAGADGRRLLVDWRTPAAAPFFAATYADPMGLVSRRRYRWTAGRVSDYWDEAFTADALEGQAALDDQSAFVASLGEHRSARMRDVLGTIQADQDAIVRADSRGVLVVDGGPGTGKTVVALHRAAYLLYADPRVGERHGGVLVIGPHRPYLAYVEDVLPSLGEEGVATCTLGDLVPGGGQVPDEPDGEVARIKGAPAMVGAIEPAVGLYEEPPTEELEVETPWGDVRLDAADWAEAFAAPDPGTPHNEARDQVLDALVDILLDRLDAAVADVREEEARRVLAADRGLHEVLGRDWPLLEATDLVGDLWEVPAYLRRCAPWLSPEEVRRLTRADPRAWTVADLPLLDAARRRLGDPDASRRRRRQRAALARERAEMDRVVEHLVATDDSEMQVMSMLRRDDLRGALVADEPRPRAADRLTGPFAHVVVDEAQELTGAEWQMVLARCPTRSLTVVGDRAQARHGFAESWEERLGAAGLDRVRRVGLSVNYRTPAAVMEAAAPVIRAVLPDANVPTSIRTGGSPVRYGERDGLPALLDAWLAAHPDGTACVVGEDAVPDGPRVRSLSARDVKGLEFDLVVLVDPDAWGGGVAGAVDRYVAMTRATQELVVLR